jgi:hypothetical protein
MEPLVRCPHCGHYHQTNIEYCPEKGLPIYVPKADEPVKTKINVLWLGIAAIVLVIIACVLMSIFVLPRLLNKNVSSTPPISVPTLTLQPLETRVSIINTQQPTATEAAVLPLPSATATSQYFIACEGSSLLTQLHVGDKAQINSEPALPNRVRSSASTNAEVLGFIQPGEQVDILEGPTCAQDWVWWRVRSVSTSLEGWTAEGDQEDYWLIPVP